MTARRLRRGWVFVAGVAGIAGIALVAWLLSRRHPATPAPQPVPVSVAEVSLRDVPVSITALGAAQAWTSVTVISQVSGKLLTVDFTEGRDVQAGQLLAQLIPRPIRPHLRKRAGHFNAILRYWQVRVST